MRYSIARCIVQIGILALSGFKATDFILKGNLSSPRLFDTLSLSDPFAVTQTYLASLSMDLMALMGAPIVLILYGVFLGCAFRAWVCPVNLITDFAAFVRSKIAFKQSKASILSENLRYYILASSSTLFFVLSLSVFESMSYIGIIHRGIIFGTTSWMFIAFILFCIDTFLSPKATCSHLYPLGALHILTSRLALLKTKHNHQKCTKCYKCIGICPGKQALWMIVKESASVNSEECIKHGRYVEVCNDGALDFNIFDLRKK